MFVKFTKTNGDSAYINPQAVSSVSKRDGATVVYIMGDIAPFEVKESVEEAVDKLTVKYEIQNGYVMPE